MKKKWLGALVLCVVAVGIGRAADEQKFGKELTLDETTEIASILEAPKDFVGKKVRVEGKVIGVCEMMGCWMEIAGDGPTAQIRAKVADGVIVFPPESMGKSAIVEGEIQEIVLSEKQAKAYRKHEAQERKTTFDPSSIKGPMTFYQIWVDGAVVK